MLSTFFAATLVASLAPQALATIFITEPVLSTTCTAGSVCNVRWNDDGNAPTLSTIGASSVGLYVGSVQQQTLLQDITDSIDVSTASSVQWTPDANVGSNGNFYFVRFSSLALKDTTNVNFPYQSFSAKFTLNGMTGTFNSTVQSQINGATVVPTGTSVGASVPTGSSTSGTPVSVTPSGSPSGTAASNTSKVATVTGSAKPSSVSGSPSPSGTTTANGASKLTGGMSVGVVAVLVSAYFAL